MNLALLVNHVAAPWSPLAPDSWGGGEEAIVQWSRAMSEQGHDVTVIWPGPALAHSGVKYFTEGTPGLTADVLICRKRPDGPRFGIAPRHILWGEGGLAVPDPAPFECIVVPSEFCRRGYEARLPGLAAVTIPLGYDPQSDCPQHMERDPNLVLHTASPDRGLTELLACWPEVMQARPEARLEIAYGWDIYDACGGPPGAKAEVQMYLDRLPNVSMRRRSRAEMAVLCGQAGIWAYYCTGGEDFCISAIKAAVNGCVPVVKPWGALHETVVPPKPFPTDRATFAAQLIDALGPDRQAELRAKTTADHCRTWDAIAQQWTALLEERTQRPTRTIRSVPTPPADLLPDPQGTAMQLLPGAVREWLQRTGAQRLWCDQNSGLAAMPLAEGELPDAVVVGWGIEDTMDPAEAVFADLAVPEGAHVMVLSSLGPWRADKRHRVLDRKTIMALFREQADMHTTVTPLTEDGSALCVTTFRYVPGKIGTSDAPARLARLNPAGSVSVCMIAPVTMPDAIIDRCLRSVESIADEVVIALNGEAVAGQLETAALVQDWARRSRIETRLVEATSPRYCFDCCAIHAVGDIAPGHRFAGFETPRNQSIAPARGDFCLWIDADEELLHGARLRKYCRPSMFKGFAVSQDHFACDPPTATKRDNPMRLFRLIRDGEPGWTTAGEQDWPTFHSGFTLRFAGLVHEHPGERPNYVDGANPVMLLPDVWFAHGGYYTEAERRGRFIRNWPLMLADHMKYQARELGWFLWLRDLAQHLRYEAVGPGGKVTMTADLAAMARECLRIYRERFMETATPYAAEAAQYAGAAATLLGEGFDVQIRIAAQCPEISAGENMAIELQGRVLEASDITAMLKPKLEALNRWTGPYR